MQVYLRFRFAVFAQQDIVGVEDSLGMEPYPKALQLVLPTIYIDTSGLNSTIPVDNHIVEPSSTVQYTINVYR